MHAFGLLCFLVCLASLGCFDAFELRSVPTPPNGKARTATLEEVAKRKTTKKTFYIEVILDGRPHPNKHSNCTSQLRTKYYMECHGDLVRHSLLKHWDEVGTKLGRSWYGV